MKIRTRRFSGRCARHKGYNPSVDGREAIKSNCPRCSLLADIWETALKLNGLIRKFDPNYDDTQARRREVDEIDDRQLMLY